MLNAKYLMRIKSVFYTELHTIGRSVRFIDVFPSAMQIFYPCKNVVGYVPDEVGGQIVGAVDGAGRLTLGIVLKPMIVHKKG